MAGLSEASAGHEYLMIERKPVRVDAQGANPTGRQIAQTMGRSSARLFPNIPIAYDA